jgi:hypothetical protein
MENDSDDEGVDSFAEMRESEVEESTIGVRLNGILSWRGRVIPTQWVCGVCKYPSTPTNQAHCQECKRPQTTEWMKDEMGELFEPGKIVRLPDGWQPDPVLPVPVLTPKGHQRGNKASGSSTSVSKGCKGSEAFVSKSLRLVETKREPEKAMHYTLAVVTDVVRMSKQVLTAITRRIHPAPLNSAAAYYYFRRLNLTETSFTVETLSTFYHTLILRRMRPLGARVCASRSPRDHRSAG